MKLLLNVLLVLTTFFACYVEDIYLFLLPPRTGQTAPITIRSQRHFRFDQEKALGGKREMAISQYVPIYAHISDRATQAAKEMQFLVERISALKSEGPSAAQRLLDLLGSQYGLQVEAQVAKQLLSYPEIENLVAGILTVEESVLQNKIVEDPAPVRGKEKIDVRYPKPVGIVSHAAGDVITLDDARHMMREKVQRLFWQMDKSILDPVLEISMSTLLPNLKYDRQENDRRIEHIVERYPSEVITYKQGDILLPFRKVVNEEDLLLLAAYRDDAEKGRYSVVIWITVAVLFIVALHELFLSKILASNWRKEPPLPLLVSLLIMTLLLCKGTLLFTALSLYVMPFAVLPALIVLLCGERIYAAWTTFMGAMLISLFADRTWDTLMLFTFGGMIAVLTSFKMQKRVHVLLPSLAVAASNAAILAAFSVDWNAVAGHVLEFGKSEIISSSEILGKGMLERIGWAFAGGLAGGPIAVLLLPLLEMSQRTTSAFKLNKFADLEHPLMKDLLTKTPATYQHTMTVAYLAEAVGQAVGVDRALLRLGAYYHDIGKMIYPKLFVENQSRGKNPHDTLPPRESARLIINHVTDGEKIGREMGLPEVALEFIRQHHGTQLMEYFYNKAVKAGDKDRIRKEDFRYPGPKPQTIEAAIIMIVDAVEAASRSLQMPTRAKLEKMIRLLVMKRVSDGQFDDCNLSTRYLARIIQTLTNAMEASCHARVPYPWQQKQAETQQSQEEALAEPPSGISAHAMPSPEPNQA